MSRSDEIRHAAERFVLEGKSNPRVRSCGHAASFFMYAAKKWLRFHGCLKVPVSPPVPFTETLDQFARYMREEQGLSPYSMDSHCSKTSMFLRWVGDRQRSPEYLAGVRQLARRFEGPKIYKYEALRRSELGGPLLPALAALLGLRFRRG